MLYPTVSDYVNQKNQSRAVASYSEEVENLSDVDYQAYFDAADDYNRRLAETPDAFYRPEEVSGYTDTLDVSGTGIMGYITISKIGVELPIYHGTSDGVLQVAAGHLEGSSLPVGGAGTHAVISAHRGLPSAKLFTNLDELEVGDTFTITVLDRVLTYEVDQISIVLPTETDLLQPVEGKDYVTLMTCNPLRHQHPPPSGARQADRECGKPETHPRNGGRAPHRAHYRGPGTGCAHAAGAAGGHAGRAASAQTQKFSERRTIMKSIRKRLAAVLAALTLLVWCAAPAFALEVVDLSRTGSIKVSLYDSETSEAVGGGTLTLYRVAKVQKDNANLSFVYTNGFEDCGVELGDLSEGVAGGPACREDRRHCRVHYRGDQRPRRSRVRRP